MALPGRVLARSIFQNKIITFAKALLRQGKPTQTMIRKILSIIAGYAIFVVTSLALFKLSGQNPHANPTTSFLIITIIYGAVFSFVSGLVTQLIAKTANLKVNYILAFIIAGFATFSFFKSEGNHWTQLLAIFIFAPVSILGGLFYKKRYGK
jgi:CDP-diglyceride synthetase